jgi:RNA polymerase sigma factor (TIGR02999 family)
MSVPAAEQVTGLLRELGRGDRAALGKLVPLVYQELHDLAERALGQERREHTLQPTALVHEAFLRLVDQRSVGFDHKAQFLGVAASLMRRVLVDHARKRRAQKREGGHERVTLEDWLVATPERQVDLEALDEALTRLAELDERQARLVELRFFGGLSNEETSKLLGISLATVKRDWTVAKAWLRRAMEEREADP